MDQRPAPADPLAAAEADLESLSDTPQPEQVALFGRIHTALASALAGTGSDAADTPVGDRPEG